MTKLAYAFVGLLLTMNAVAAQPVPNTWQGSVTITQLTGAGCAASEGLTVGDLWTAVYRPRIGTSGPTRLQFASNRGATNYAKAGGGQMDGAGAYSATKLGGRAGVNTFNGNFNLNSTPANVVAETPRVTLTGTFTNFEDNPGCMGTISATFTKRPPN